MKHRLLWPLACLLACLLAGPAFAGLGAVLKQVEASMVVTGTILVEGDGRVSDYTMDHADKLPKEVTRLLARTVPRWTFEPVRVDGKPVRVKAAMSLLVVARKLGDEDNYLLKIRSANFGEQRSRQRSASDQMPPPEYPLSAADAGISGTVYLIVRVGPDGRVHDAIAEQVNLWTIASQWKMRNWREVLARSALRVTEKWVIAPQPGDETATTGYELFRVPVNYMMDGEATPSYGEWAVYVPGPRQTTPWPEAAAAPSPDALAPGGIYALTQALRLLTPLG